MVGMNIGVVCASSLCCSLQEVSVPCHKDVISSVPSGLQGDCKKNGLEQKQIQNGSKVPSFSSFVCPRSQCFSAKTI
jgi:hypothetical protein